ncbi:MAG: hypothetical protein HOM34_10170 [Planctomycetes bacterium]|jgi:hypothetical protein|nr:hypothetical protein [Planctomycetota bacterium]MBT4559717.1 hypothetical protein [Planctomycetota bacterium]MBT5102040.1 hypothetical protein [Planctomycetota bacterium]MBT5121075.1 hypothetical protein [Planctomycetota bacterium]MBT7012996.1 hypothetical protein [Planctomycetota bacterium]
MTAGKKIAAGCGVTLLLITLALGGGTWYVFHKANATFDATEIRMRADSVLPIAIPAQCEPKVSFAPDGEFTTTVFYSSEADRLVISITGMDDAPDDDTEIWVSQNPMATEPASPNPTGESTAEILSQEEWLIPFRGQTLEAGVRLEIRQGGETVNYYLPIPLDNRFVILTISAEPNSFSKEDVLALLETLPADYQ